jgi:hypothetical protein
MSMVRLASALYWLLALCSPWVSPLLSAYEPFIESFAGMAIPSETVLPYGMYLPPGTMLPDGALVPIHTRMVSVVPLPTKYKPRSPPEETWCVIM